MPITKATTNVLDLNSDTLINGVTVGKGGGNLSQNTALGVNALKINTSGNGNTAIGRDSLYNNSSGSNNVAVSVNALFSNTTGSQNTAIGYLAMQSGNYTNSSCVGFGSQVTGNNQVQLGNSSTTTYAYGTVQDRSDNRDKADIRDTTLGLDFIKELRPVDFKWDYREDYREAPPILPNEDASDEEKQQYKEAKEKWIEDVKLSNITHDGTHKRNRFHHGLIAQDIKSVIEKTGIDFGGFQDHSINGGDEVMTVGYIELIAPLIKAVQELSAKVEALESK